jgi:hypothetical protein
VAFLALLCAVPAAAIPNTLLLSIGQRVEGLGPIASFATTACLGADGRVFTGVRSVDGQRALACGDVVGAIAIARQNDPSPRGGVFVDFTDCATTVDGSIYFSATRSTPDGAVREDVYRATPAGIEWVVGPGAIAADGSVLRQLLSLDGGNVPGWPVFEVNDRGTVLVRAAYRQVASVRTRACQPKLLNCSPPALLCLAGRGSLSPTPVLPATTRFLRPAFAPRANRVS